MTKNIQTILAPFLIISYIIGLRIANVSINHLKLWLSLSYMLLIWLAYYFLATSPLIHSITKLYPTEFYIYYTLEIFISLLSIVFGIYHDKKFQNCLKRLNIVDNTLLDLGTITGYDKLHKKTLWVVLGWLVIVLSINSITAYGTKISLECGILTAIIHVFVRNYSFHINAIGDLTTATILVYLGLKFDQINKHLQNLATNNNCKMIQENLTTHSHQCRFSKAINNECISWIIIHLHLELRKISYEIDEIFGKQMSFKMTCYFLWIVYELRKIFCLLLDNHIKSDKILIVVINLLWFLHNFSKFMLINCVCETVSIKASATAELMNRLYSTCGIEIREIISQFSLQMTYAPLRFCGIGFFQFGYKFLYKFIMSIGTVLVIILQARENK